jgi:hypothetical protein
MRSLPPNARSGQAQNAVILTDDGFVVEIVVKAQ